jgi:periplasmic divalent cation tolerance protein
MQRRTKIPILFFIIILGSMINVLSTSKIIIGFVSFPNAEVAKKIARILVTDKLVACAKVINNIDSFYMWEGALQEDHEVYLMIKSRENKVSGIKKVLDSEHPYKVYEFLYHEVKSVNEKYSDWIIKLLDDSGEVGLTGESLV